MKKHLIDNPETYTSDADVLHTFFSEKTNRYCIEFNAVLITYRTVTGFNLKLQKMIVKYKLVKE